MSGGLVMLVPSIVSATCTSHIGRPVLRVQRDQRRVKRADDRGGCPAPTRRGCSGLISYGFGAFCGRV